MQLPTIIYEDNHLLIVEKPPGFLSQGDGRSRADLLSWAEQYLAQNKPGRAFVGLVHRLDRPVGGVMVLAKTSKCASRLSRQFRERLTHKLYLALIEGSPQGPSGLLEQALVRDGTITRPALPHEQGTNAGLTWQVWGQPNNGLSLLSINLKTGFKHQIRAQLAAMGHPVVGDIKYGSQIAPHNLAIGLWALSLTLKHPTLGTDLCFQAPLPHMHPWLLAEDLRLEINHKVKQRMNPL
ncbi:MAG: RluA family pseudouridine synthase [Candidatus Adiutrix sp.]